MKLTRIQQIGLAILVCSLFPAYFIAHWRYEAKLANLDEMFQKEQALHTSTDKLLNNCENNPAHKAEPYDAAHRICSQGADMHARTEHEMAVLNEYKAKNEMARYWNFGLAGACPRFCVNGLMAGNCRDLQRKRNDRKQRIDRPPVGGLQKA